MKYSYTIAAGAAATLIAASVASAGTLDDVKARGHLLCGVTTGLAGFAAPDDKGEWSGLDVEVCRAVAAGIFGDPNAVKFVTSTAKTRGGGVRPGKAGARALGSAAHLSSKRLDA